jgi:hypothetical protein
VTISRTTLNKLFTLSGNVCAFPRCRAPIYDTEHDVMTGQICHIKAKSPNGPRYDESQTSEERDGFANLILMCAAHNKIADDKATRDKFPVELLTKYKRSHEARYQNSVVETALINRFIARARAMLPTPTPSSTTTITAARLTRDDQTGIDTYAIRIAFQNDSRSTIENLRLEVEIPKSYSSSSLSSPAKIRKYAAGSVHRYCMVVRNQKLHPTECFQLTMTVSVTRNLYKSAATDKIAVILRSGDRRLFRDEHSIADLLDQERMRKVKLSL